MSSTTGLQNQVSGHAGSPPFARSESAAPNPYPHVLPCLGCTAPGACMALLDPEGGACALWNELCSPERLLRTYGAGLRLPLIEPDMPALCFYPTCHPVLLEFSV